VDKNYHFLPQGSEVMVEFTNYFGGLDVVDVFIITVCSIEPILTFS